MIKDNKIIRILPPAIIILGFINNIITDDITYNAFESLPFFANFQYKIITMPELFIAMIILFAYTIIISLYDGIASKKKEKCDNAKAKKVIFISNILVISLSAICVILSAFTLITTKTGDIPEVSDGKYLDIHDFGIADKITEKGYNYSDKEIPNKITIKKTISAQLTLTHEHYDIGDKSVIIFQDILEYSNEKTALKAAELLSSDKYKNYKEHTTEGFNKVYCSDEDLIAVIDSTVYKITIIANKSLVPDTDHMLEIIKLKK